MILIKGFDDAKLEKINEKPNFFHFIIKFINKSYYIKLSKQLS